MYFRGIGKDRSKTVFHWGKDDSTKKTEVDVKSRTQATIRSPILMPSAANWTAGQLQGLVPAIWTVTDGNITGIKCNVDAGASTSFNECRDRLGHDRGQCYGTLNGSSICTCSSFSGWDYSCNEARCTYGTVSGCATRIPVHYYMSAVCLTLAAILVTTTLVYALSTVWKGRAVCSRSVTSTTLAWLTFAALSLWVRHVAMFIAYVVLSSSEVSVG